MKKVIIFDMYGVIIEESKGNFIPYTYKYFPQTDRAFLKEQFSKAQKGLITNHEFLSILGFPDPESSMKDYIENYLALDKEFFTFVRRYGSKYDFALLSNDVGEWSDYLMSFHRLDRYIKTRVVSAHTGFRKPEKDIYLFIQEKLGCLPEDVIFVDNSVKNLTVAREIGWKPVLFNRDGEEPGDITAVYSFEELGLALRQEEFS